MFRMLVACMLVSELASSLAGTERQPRLSDPEAIRELRQGKRDEANARWWGFDPSDATQAIEQAVDSRASKVTIPYMGRPWIVRPIQLRSDLELYLEPGVILLAKKGEYRGSGDSMFSMLNATKVTIRGYGAVLRMRKEDYQNPPYKKAEWRMGIRMHGCHKIRIEGLRIESSGGDGIYIDGSLSQPTEDITIRDCVCYDNHRQGISVICAKDLLIENCIFSHTRGTPPEAGIDFEPDGKNQYFVNCRVRNCVFDHNSGHAILVYLKPMTRASRPVSIRFENCVARMGKPGMRPEEITDSRLAGWAGMAVGAIRDDGPQGLIEFVNCTTENTGREGVKIFDKSARSATVRFDHCNWGNCWLASVPNYAGPRVPVLFEARRPSLAKQLGGVEFVDCHVYDSADRPVVDFWRPKTRGALEDVTGKITRYGPHRAHVESKEMLQQVDLKVANGSP